MNFRMLAFATILSPIVLPYATSQTTAQTAAASAQTAVPPLVPYSGQVEGPAGERPVTFLIYKEQQGGEPLFTESQMISFDQAGRYKVQLGAANPSGLPAGLFSSGEARWMEVQIAGRQPEPRVLLASVPYALKAADAATLGGLPASAFALAGSSNGVVLNAATPGGVSPDAATTVTTTGGTANKLAKFSGSNTVVNSTVYDNGTQIGVGTTAPTATLTVGGTATVNGNTTLNGQVILPATGKATATKSYNSQSIKLQTSVYDSTTKSVVTPRFVFQAEAKGNNTDLPTGTLNLLASATSTPPAETGLFINTDGTINFAPGQTFGATVPYGVALTGFADGTTTTGVGVEGTSILGDGVVGFSTSSSGVLGGTPGTAAGTAAVLGSNYGGGIGIGVFGYQSQWSNTGLDCKNLVPAGAGVWGDSYMSLSHSFTPAVLGSADDQYAGYFLNDSETTAALRVENGIGIGGAPAAYFGGKNLGCSVDTSGNLFCAGSKSAVVPVDNNSRKVALYAVESPENWFEDFGSGQLSNGVATVRLEPVFAQTVNLGVDYRVFLTPNGDSKGLYISSKTATSFEVREAGSGRSTLAFDYRIVARRKGYEAIRLADKTKQQEMSRSPLMMTAHRAKGATQ